MIIMIIIFILWVEFFVEWNLFFFSVSSFNVWNIVIIVSGIRYDISRFMGLMYLLLRLILRVLKIL